MIFAPLEGWRRVKVTDRHAAADYAQMLKELSDVHFPDAEQIRLVQDNLGTHTPASLYAAFPAPEARRLANTSSIRPSASTLPLSGTALWSLAELLARESKRLATINRRLCDRGFNLAITVVDFEAAESRTSGGAPIMEARRRREPEMASGGGPT